MQTTKFDRNNAITLEQVFHRVKKSDYEKFDDVLTVNSNTLFYLKKFEKYGHRRFFLSLNWSFAFLGVIWMAYRKMYWVLYFVVLPLLLHCVATILLTGKSANLLNLLAKISSLVSDNSAILHYIGIMFYILIFAYLILAIPLLFMGNMIYFYHIKRWIRKSSPRKGVSKVALYAALIFPVTNLITTIIWDSEFTNLADQYKSMSQEINSSNHDEPSEPY